MKEERNVVISEVTEYLPELLHSVRSLVEQLDAQYQSLTEEELRSILSSETTHLFLARKGQKIVGMITLVVFRIPYKKKGFLEDLVVDVAHRRQGIGEKLLQFAITWAKELGVHSLALTSRPSREGANNLYEKVGFEKRDTNVYQVPLK